MRKLKNINKAFCIRNIENLRFNYCIYQNINDF